MKQSTLELKKITPDEHQPREYFDATKMHSLKESVRAHGIMSPLVVQEVKDGNYLLIDGERRYRVATELKLKEVPVVIEPLTKEIDRLVRQFNIQEQHEAWTPLEKARALIKIAAELGLSLPATCKLLNIPEGTASRYIAFSELANPESFIKNEIPLDFARPFKMTRKLVKRLSVDQLEKEFTPAKEKQLEARMIKSIKEGEITNRKEFTYLTSAFIKDPKNIEKYMGDSKITPTTMFIESGAQDTRMLTNLVVTARYAEKYAKDFLAGKNAAISDVQLQTLKRCREALGKVIDLVE